MKAQRGGRGMALIIFNLGAGLAWVANATRPPLYPGKEPLGLPVVHEVGLDGCGEKRISFLHWFSNPQPFSP